MLSPGCDARCTGGAALDRQQVLPEACCSLSLGHFFCSDRGGGRLSYQRHNEKIRNGRAHYTKLRAGSSAYVLYRAVPRASFRGHSVQRRRTPLLHVAPPQHRFTPSRRMKRPAEPQRRMRAADAAHATSIFDSLCGRRFVSDPREPRHLTVTKVRTCRDIKHTIQDVGRFLMTSEVFLSCRVGVVLQLFSNLFGKCCMTYCLE